MASRRPDLLSRDLHTLLRSGTSAGLTDGQLLERFARRHEEEAEVAFLALVERHGPMVLHVCREVLRDPHDAEDAFQATFLVLVRRAGSIRSAGSVGSWLYGVALRVASCSRLASARRRARERKAAESALRPEGPDLDADTSAAILEEVGRLPEKYRAPVVLCYLQGLTHEQAAESLGWPVGTVRSRLSGARERLRPRLARRGLAPSAGLLPEGLSGGAAAVPEALAAPTARAAAELVTGRATSAGLTRSAVVVLAERTLKEMTMVKLRTWALGTLAVSALCAAGVFAAHTLRAADGAKARKAPPAESRRAGAENLGIPTRDEPDPIKRGDTLVIEVLEALPGRPINGERLVRPDGTVSLGFYGDLKVAGLTRNQAKAKLVNHLRKFLPDEILGLEVLSDNDTPDDESDDKVVRVDPADSDRVFIDDSLKYRSPKNPDADGLGHKLDKILEALQKQGSISRPAPRAEAGRDPLLIDHERRLAEVERKLEEVLEKLGERRGEGDR